MGTLATCGKKYDNVHIATEFRCKFMPDPEQSGRNGITQQIRLQTWESISKIYGSILTNSNFQNNKKMMSFLILEETRSKVSKTQSYSKRKNSVC